MRFWAVILDSESLVSTALSGVFAVFYSWANAGSIAFDMLTSSCNVEPPLVKWSFLLAVIMSRLLQIWHTSIQTLWVCSSLLTWNVTKSSLGGSSCSFSLCVIFLSSPGLFCVLSGTYMKNYDDCDFRLPQNSFRYCNARRNQIIQDDWSVCHPSTSWGDTASTVSTKSSRKRFRIHKDPLWSVSRSDLAIFLHLSFSGY